MAELVLVMFCLISMPAVRRFATTFLSQVGLTNVNFLASTKHTIFIFIWFWRKYTKVTAEKLIHVCLIFKKKFKTLPKGGASTSGFRGFRGCIWIFKKPVCTVSRFQGYFWASQFSPRRGFHALFASKYTIVTVRLKTVLVGQ